MPEKFHWNLHCHKPDIFFCNRRDSGHASRPINAPASSNLAPYAPQAHTQQPTLQLSAAPPQSSSSYTAHSIGRGAGTTIPAWMTTSVQ